MKSLRRPHCLSVFILGIAFTTSVFAQRERDTYTTASPSSFEVTGQVNLAETGLPLGTIPIRLERFGGGVVDQIDTDSRGRFRFPNLPRGYYRIVINAPGYRQVQQDADLQVIFRAHLVFDLVSDKSNASNLVLTEVIDAKASPEAREELMRGRQALAKKDPDGAIVHLEKAILLYPDFFDAHLLMGTACMDKRDWAQAQTRLERALELKPDSVATMVKLGEVQWRQKHDVEAEKLLVDALKLDDKSWYGQFTLARLYWERGDIAKTAPAIGKTLQLKPDFAPGHLLAGNVLLRVSQRERALMEYQEYLRLDPKGEFAAQTRELIEKLNKEIAASKK
jgi:tetratricopeptide (TPR) repeat protein